jgi:hypothetical protein
LLPVSWQTAHARASLKDITKAREVAEALFKPRQSILQPKAPIEVVSAPATAAEAPRRKPRIFAAQPPVPVRHEPSSPPTKVKPKSKRAAVARPAKKIAEAHHGRIRTLAAYGMTLEQVAELYDVPVRDIAKITA